MSGVTAIIGSVAVCPDALGVKWRRENVPTRAGTVPVLLGELDGRPLAYVTRSRGRSGVPPHLVSYKANLTALRKVGADRILATSVVGALDPNLTPGTLVVLDQFLDFTRTRLTTMFGGGGFANVDFTEPYCPGLRQALHHGATAVSGGVRVHECGCYVGVDGPRYETKAEVAMYRRLGGDVIGMTGLPEVVLAREAGLCYAALAVVSNPAAGLADGKVSRREHHRLVEGMADVLGEVLRTAARAAARAAAGRAGETRATDARAADAGIAGALAGDTETSLSPSGTQKCDCAQAAADFVPAEPGESGAGASDPPTAVASPSGAGGDAGGDAGADEWSLVLVRPSVLRRHHLGLVVSRLEQATATPRAGIRGLKLVRLDEESVAALYDREGIANLLPGILDVHIGYPAVAVALAGPPGTCAKVEATVDDLRDLLTTDALHNGVHASGDPETAKRELALFFAPADLMPENHDAAHGGAVGGAAHGGAPCP